MRGGLLLILAFSLSTSSPAGAAVLHVPSGYPLIQKAVDAASPGDTVLVAPGTYSDCVHVSQEADGAVSCVVMKSGITLLGSGAEVTTIDAQLLGMCIYCKNVTDALIEGFTLKNADEEKGGWQWAPALFCRLSSPTIRSCDIGPNFDGGIICKQSADPVIADCTFTGNVAKSGGGLHIAQSSNPTVQDCDFHDNAAPIGGALYVESSSPTIEDCDVTNNTASGTGNGGGLLSVYGSPIVRHCLFADNDCGANGGGLCFEQSGGQVIACTVRGNESLGDNRHGGGVCFLDHSSTTMDSSTVVLNTVWGYNSDGGGVYCDQESDVSITNCTVAQNSLSPAAVKGLRSQGGGICCEDASPAIERTIMAFNRIGAGLACIGSAIPQVSCCDVYNNQGGDAICGVDGGGNFSADPLFCDTLSYNYGIEWASPCAPGSHPAGADTCGGALIGAAFPGCFGSVEDEGARLTRNPLVVQSTPNPFSLSTRIVFGLTEPARVTLRIYDVTGREVAALVDRPMSVGTHRVTWDGTTNSGTHATSGIYFYRLTVSGRSQTGRLVMVH